MLIPTLLTLALQGSSPPIATFHGDPRAPAAWVAAADAQLWICWEGPLTPATTPEPGCWQRIPLEMAPVDAGTRLAIDAGDAAAFRLGFLDPRTLALLDDRGHAWTIQRDGLPLAAIDEIAEAAQGALTPQACSTSGWLPRRDRDHRWRWESAPCALDDACPIVAPAIRRRPLPFDLSLMIGAHLVDDRGVDDQTLGGARGGQVMIAVAVGFDLHRARLARQELARLAAFTRTQERGLPPARTSAPLAELETTALRRARCRAWEGVR